MLLPPLPLLDGLGDYVPRFLALIGEDRWFRRANRLDQEQQKSFFRWKIVSDYHWLEMGISYQADVLAKEGRLVPELVDALTLASLYFAANTIQVHEKLTDKGKQVLEGRLRDGLNAETGYSALYFELDLARRLMDAGYDVFFSDMEGRARFDLFFSRGAFAGEVECKSLSADAGRQIHRKDFYRFMEAISTALVSQAQLERREVLLVTVATRLPRNDREQAELLKATRAILLNATTSEVRRETFELVRYPLTEVLGSAQLDDPKELYKSCGTAFGPNTHVAGRLTEKGGCLVVMRSKREDDTSRPMLDAMREASGQLSGKLPAMIAIQEHGIEAADVMLPRLRRQTAILSYALFGHYGATHVNATYVSGFGAVVARDGKVASPAFIIPNPEPAFPMSDTDASPFFDPLPDEEYAAAIGAPLPAPNISLLPFDLPENQSMAGSAPGPARR